MMKRSIIRQSPLLQYHTQLSPPSSRIQLSQSLLPKSRPSPLRYFSSSHFSFAPVAEASNQTSERDASPPSSVSDLPQDGDKVPRTELEQKNKEIIDLKVSFRVSFLSLVPFDLSCYTIRTNICVLSLISATSKTAPPETKPKHETSPSPVSRGISLSLSTILTELSPPSLPKSLMQSPAAVTRI